jgi:imidazolonepropionase
LEIKSGYGLTVADEARLVAIAATLTTEVTFLGAHVVPAEFRDRPDEYLALVIGPMMDACAAQVRWVDVFCERGAFDGAATRAALAAGARHGLGLRVHAGQLGPGPGVAIACELGAASVDHATHLAPGDVDALAATGTVATLLPGAEFSTRSPYADGRRLVDAGVVVALASDCNPGTSFTTSMPLMVALAVREMRLSVTEALWAATAGGARALRRADIGTLALGSQADAVVIDAPDPGWLAYRPGVDLVHAVVRGGVVVRRRSPL